jgi:hypothetical protein
MKLAKKKNVKLAKKKNVKIAKKKNVKLAKKRHLVESDLKKHVLKQSMGKYVK